MTPASLQRLLPEPMALGEASPPFPLWFVRPGPALDGESLALLSDEERHHVARLRTPAHRHRNLRVRLTLRGLVEQICGVPAGMQHYARNRWGKPMLVGVPGLNFSLSYSGDYGVIGISTEHEIGVDIERERPIADVAELSSLCFADDEQSQAEQAFLVAWTRKEACLKALGRGLQIRPDRVRCGCTDAPAIARLNDAIVHIASTRLQTGHNLAWAWRSTVAASRKPPLSRLRLAKG